MSRYRVLRNSLLTLLVSMLGFGEASAQQAYAVYTESDATLTFKYGNNYMTGQAYRLNTESNDPGWYKDGTSNKVERVVFDASFATVRPTSTFRWFYYMENLEDIEGIKYLNTSEVTNMDWMFSHCRHSIYKYLSLDTRNVTTMRGMFAYCDMKTFSMNIDTRNVTDMSRMFYKCTQLEKADLSYFNVSKVTDMSSMFRGCSALTTIYVGNEWNPSNCQQSTDMFDDCTSIVGGAGSTYNSYNTDRRFAYVDGGPTNPGYLTLNDLYAVFNTRQKTLTFYHDTNMASRTGTTYYLNRVGTYEAWRADGTNKLVTIAVIDDSFADVRPTSIRYWFYEMENLEHIVGIVENLDISEVTDLRSMFYGCRSLREVDLSYFDTHHVTNMNSMFYGCSALTYIFVGNGWNTDKVIDGSYMFWGCTSLVGQKGTAYDQSHVGKDYAHADNVPWSPGYLILGAPYVEVDGSWLRFYYDARRSERTGKTYSLNVKNNDPKWSSDVNNVLFDISFRDYRPTSTRGWFAGMRYVSSISTIQYLNTSAVTNMSRMFSSCMQLVKVDLSNFNTENVTDMSSMFYNCKALTSLNLSDFDTHKVTNMERMFQDCSALKAIYVGDGWSTDNCQKSTDMFKNCTSLVGAQGTVYDENQTGGAYAHIDGGTDNPGYLSGKVPYAIYYNGTLTFYYDYNVDRRSGVSYRLNSGPASIPAWYNDKTYKDVKSVVFDPSFADARPTTTSGWFMEMSNLKTITGMEEYLNTSEVTGTTWMFYGCSLLESVDVSNFYTQKVTMMNSMFYGCTSLKTLDLSSFNTASATDIAYMFSGCSNLKTIYVGERWNAETVRTTDWMFKDCTSLVGSAGTTYDADHTDGAYAHGDGGPSNPGYLTCRIAYVVHSGQTLTYYYDDKSSTRTGDVYVIWKGEFVMASGANGKFKNVTNAVFDPSFADARLTETSGLFGWLESLKSITGMKEYLNTSKVTHMYSMFNGCKNLESLDLSNFDTQKVKEMGRMFADCSKLTTIYVSDKWSVENLQASANMFYGCTSLVGGAGTTYDAEHTDGAYAHIDGGTSNPGYLTLGTFLKGDVNNDGQVGIGDIVAVTNVMAGIETNPDIIARADVNADTQVGIGDIVAITNIMAGKE